MDENNLPENDETIKAEADNPVDPQADVETHVDAHEDDHLPEEAMQDRLERLGGEPAPVITPDEFARLQKDGSVHIDSRGRVRTTRRQNDEPGVSLRKRRAWYL